MRCFARGSAASSLFCARSACSRGMKRSLLKFTQPRRELLTITTKPPLISPTAPLTSAIADDSRAARSARASCCHNRSAQRGGGAIQSVSSAHGGAVHRRSGAPFLEPRAAQNATHTRARTLEERLPALSTFCCINHVVGHSVSSQSSAMHTVRECGSGSIASIGDASTTLSAAFRWARVSDAFTRVHPDFAWKRLAVSIIYKKN